MDKYIYFYDHSNCHRYWFSPDDFCAKITKETETSIFAVLQNGVKIRFSKRTGRKVGGGCRLIAKEDFLDFARKRQITETLRATNRVEEAERFLEVEKSALEEIEIKYKQFFDIHGVDDGGAV